MKHYLSFSLVTSAFVAVLLAFPPGVSASAGKEKQATEHESVDIEHRTTHEQKELEHDDVPALSKDMDEDEGMHQEVRKEHREIHRESGEQKESHHHDD